MTDTESGNWVMTEIYIFDHAYCSKRAMVTRLGLLKWKKKGRHASDVVSL